MKHEELNAIIRSHYALIKKLEAYVSNLPKKFRTLSCPSDIILTEVEREFNVDVTKNTRKKNVMYAKHCAVYLLRKHTSSTWQEISFMLGNADHSTSIHSYKTAANLIFSDDVYRLSVEAIQDRLSDFINKTI
jgi:chromosomal replication initiation ATPase DnaA